MEKLQPPGWPRPSGYANGIRVPAGRDLVFIAGQVGWNQAKEIVPGGFVAQLEQALRNVVSVLAEAGGGPEDIARMTVYVTDLAAYRQGAAEIGVAWRRVLGRCYPTMSLVEVKGLLEPGAVVEVEATAAVPARP